jgi:predicted ATPase
LAKEEVGFCRTKDDPVPQALDIALALRLAISVSAAIGALHQRGIIHKDIKPANVLVNSVTGQCWLTGFGIASRLPRERQHPGSPEFIAGTLPYMAPEQTGRMNRSVDSRSDLYALGVTLYEMLTGTLPFSAADPMEWVHCHIARQPVPPNIRSKTIPASLSGIVMKLLAKTGEERYQTAAGVESDLRRCLDEWEGSQPVRHGRLRGASDPSQQSLTATADPRDPLLRRAGTHALPSDQGSAHDPATIDPFPLGEHDTPDRLLIPEKLYGRAREIDTLLASFDRVVANGRPELVLVSGYSGIGKSSVVNELHKVLVPPRGLFASGKFDQYKRNVPYSTLAQAFQSLIRPLLAKSEAELRNWREALHEALGPNGGLMLDPVPELKLIIGEQPAVPDLPPQDAKARFQLVFRRFVSVFARPEHPLALFVDDLQWLDAATLDFLQDLLTSDFAYRQISEPAAPELRRTTQPDVSHLMLIGAYRDNEVDSAHPLRRKLDALRQAGAPINEIVLAPLSCEDLQQLLVDALHCEPERAKPLAHLVHAKTVGNPFFAIQFITALAEENFLNFDHGAGRWSWDLNRIQEKGYTDNVADLMVGRLSGLAIETQKALQQFACLGNSAAISTLSIVHGISEEELASDLWQAEHLEFIVRLDGLYKFAHDRVQEAAYSLIPASARAEAHLRIGRLLKAHTLPQKRAEAVFEIVSQFNRGTALITSREEREEVAELNLLAGKRAKTSTAYASALKYLISGSALLADDAWERTHELAFALEFHRAECEFLTGRSAAAEERLRTLSSRAANTVELATVTCLRVDLDLTLGQSDRAVDVGLDFLRYLGVEWSPNPAAELVRREYERIWINLGSRAVEQLIDLPLMSDPASLATMDVLTKVLPASGFTDANLNSLVVCRMVNLSLEHGSSDGSSFAYVCLGMIAGPHFDNYQAGFRFGQLGYELVEKRGLKRFQARTYMLFGSHVMTWTKHVRACRDLVRRAFDAANEAGDLVFAAASCSTLNTNLLAAGDPLVEVQREAERGLEFAQKARLDLVLVKPELGLIRTLRGLTPKFGSFDDEQFDELQFERHLASHSVALPECFYWIRKLQARFFAGDYASAVDASLRAQRLLWTAPSHFELAEYYFYSALARAAVFDSSFLRLSRTKEEHFTGLVEHHKQLALWAENCPENFENRAALVGAEIARIEGRALDAMDLYEHAIRSAHANGFIQNEALASELAARFYAARGFDLTAQGYLRKARD